MYVQCLLGIVAVDVIITVIFFQLFILIAYCK